jgi:hypothetical protein
VVFTTPLRGDVASQSRATSRGPLRVTFGPPTRVRRRQLRPRDLHIECVGRHGSAVPTPEISSSRLQSELQPIAHQVARTGAWPAHLLVGSDSYSRPAQAGRSVPLPRWSAGARRARSVNSMGDVVCCFQGFCRFVPIGPSHSLTRLSRQRERPRSTHEGLLPMARLSQYSRQKDSSMPPKLRLDWAPPHQTRTTRVSPN